MGRELGENDGEMNEERVSEGSVAVMGRRKIIDVSLICYYTS